MRYLLSNFIVLTGMCVGAEYFATSAAEASEPAIAASIEPQAKQHLEAGIKALQAKQWEKARDELLVAWQTDKHYRIAANLGLVEIELRQYREAAEHLQYCLVAQTDLSDEHRAAVQSLFDKARAQVGVVEVRTDEPGIAILLDGEVVGQTPMPPIFVEPGRRNFVARMPGKSYEEKPVQVAAGQTTQVLIAEQGPVTPLPEPRKEEPSSSWKMVAIPAGAFVTVAGLGVGVGCAGTLGPSLNPEERRERTAGAAIGFSVGGIALVTMIAVALWPEADPKRTVFFISPVVGAGQAGVHAGGSF